jgi:hypothetical protein
LTNDREKMIRRLMAMCATVCSLDRGPRSRSRDVTMLVAEAAVTGVPDEVFTSVTVASFFVPALAPGMTVMGTYLDRRVGVADS